MTRELWKHNGRIEAHLLATLIYRRSPIKSSVKIICEQLTLSLKSTSRKIIRNKREQNNPRVRRSSAAGVSESALLREKESIVRPRLSKKRCTSNSEIKVVASVRGAKRQEVIREM